MIRILPALILVASSLAQADTWEQPNRSGGKLVLTDRTCTDSRGPDLQEVYSYTSAGETMRGCWGLIDERVHIVWSDGHLSIHDPETFSDGQVDQPYRQPQQVRNPATSTRELPRRT